MIIDIQSIKHTNPEGVKLYHPFGLYGRLTRGGRGEVVQFRLRIAYQAEVWQGVG